VASKQALDSLDNHESMLMAANKLYEVEDKTSSLGIGLYFDDPFEIEHPQWGAGGWAAQGPTFKELRAFVVPHMNEASVFSSPETNTIRVVHVGGKAADRSGRDR
jgi:hypothetical protein